MRVGVHLGLWTACPTVKEHKDLLCRIKEWGFDGIEIPVAPMSDSDIRALAALSDDLGLGRVVNLVLHAGEADPASPEPALRAAAVDCLKRVVDRTLAIGADLIEFGGCAAGPGTSEPV